MTTTTEPIGPSTAESRASWAGVASLSMVIFAIVISEFLPAGLLPHVAGNLDVSVGAAGQAVSVTAFAAALPALLISAVLPGADRRRVMIGLTWLAVLSNVVVALARTWPSCWSRRSCSVWRSAVSGRWPPRWPRAWYPPITSVGH